MENMVFSELEKHKEYIRKVFREKYDASDEEIDTITGTLENVLKEMIRLMREGKNAHEKFFSDIILNSIDAIIGFDNDEKIFLWNKGAEKIFGFTKEEAVGRTVSFFIPEHLIEKGEEEFLMKSIREKGFVANYETERITKDGKTVNVSISRFSIFDEDNKPIGTVGIVRDITLVKSLERELREKENLALIGEVVSSIAHSLSNPLNIISGNADYLLLGKKEGDTEFEELKTILDETTRITKSIRHLLNFSRPIKVNKSDEDLNHVINGILSKAKYLLEGKKITVKKNLSAAVPKFAFDKGEIEEVVMNLVSNSIQAISGEGKITVKTDVNGGSAVIEVTDTGQGIPKENLEKIFLPFFSSKEYGKGTGLGLSLARRIVHEHNGEIKVKSNVGKGTTFTVTLPM